MRLQVRRDLFAKHLRLLLIRNEQENDFTLCRRLWTAYHPKTRFQGRFFVLIVTIADDDLRDAAIAQILRLRRPLVAIADECDTLSLNQGEIGVVVVVDRGSHGDVSFLVL